VSVDTQSKRGAGPPALSFGPLRAFAAEATGIARALVRSRSLRAPPVAPREVDELQLQAVGVEEERCIVFLAILRILGWRIENGQAAVLGPYPLPRLYLTESLLIGRRENAA